jgi:hypothetical protein
MFFCCLWFSKGKKSIAIKQKLGYSTTPCYHSLVRRFILVSYTKLFKKFKAIFRLKDYHHVKIIKLQQLDQKLQLELD